ncbi:sucrase ferredoxin [Corynebacterium sp.]|uniref:sucrase ferredoxin n=1 Tax=Corynebacterium sp. TaxID=1720 RepID=UPI0026DB22E5|nr:sucrase ferredoxin [Corynebacterium sp.]MDO5077111.1 sucrase ferredoxin [Corynebacterium sp.]
MSTTTRCSAALHEPLPGTAKEGSVYVLLEHLQGWGRDVLDGVAFGADLTADIKAHLKKTGAQLQLIRKPGRAARHRTHRRMYLVFCELGVIETLAVTGPAAILRLDLTGPGRNGAEPVDHPLALVCTHGKRDMCCALKGRPVAAAMQTCFFGDEIWESSHTKGHRFAPSMLLFPWGYSYGRLKAPAAIEMLKRASLGEMYLKGNRGRGTFDSIGQVAELAVAEVLLDAREPLAPGTLMVASDGETTRVVGHPDGRRWRVQLEQQEVDGVIASCGGVPTVGHSWVVTSVEHVG